MEYAAHIIATESKTVRANCYFDGHGFTMLRDQAKRYVAREYAADALPFVQDTFRQPCWIEAA